MQSTIGDLKTVKISFDDSTITNMTFIGTSATNALAFHAIEDHTMECDLKGGKDRIIGMQMGQGRNGASFNAVRFFLTSS